MENICEAYVNVCCDYVCDIGEHLIISYLNYFNKMLNVNLMLRYFKWL